MILHAGTHKTGTTAIQAFCSANRGELERRGYLYPKLPIKGPRASNQHHDLAHAVGDQSKRMTKEIANSLAKHWSESASRSGKTVFLSAEPVWRHTLRDHTQSSGMEPGPDDAWLAGRQGYLRDLASALESFEVHGVVVFRNPVDFAQSTYLERINSSVRGTTDNFSQFVSGLLGNALRYAHNCRLFRLYFESLDCLVYEDLCEENLIDNFFDAAGIPVQGMSSGAIVRKSISPAQAKVHNFIKHSTPEWASRLQVKEVLSDPSLCELINTYVEKNRHCDFWESAEARMALMDAMASQLELLEKEFNIDTTRWMRSLADRPAPKQLEEIDPVSKRAIANKVEQLWGDQYKRNQGREKRFFLLRKSSKR